MNFIAAHLVGFSLFLSAASLRRKNVTYIYLTTQDFKRYPVFLKISFDLRSKFSKSYHIDPQLRFDIPSINKKILLTMWDKSNKKGIDRSYRISE